MSDTSMLLDVTSSSLAVVVLVWGLYILLTGKFRFLGDISQEGRQARMASLFLLTPLLSAYLIPALLYVDESRGLGSFVKLLTLLSGVGGAVIYARAASRKEVSVTITLVGKIMLTVIVLILAMPTHAAILSVLRNLIANYKPVPASITLLLLAAGWLLIFRIIVRVAELSRGKARLVGSIIAILFVAFHAWVTVGTPRTGVDASIAQALAPVCSGQGVQEAAEYTGGPGPHTTVVLDSSGGLYESPRGLGPGWNPSSVSDTELVLCVGEEIGKTPLCPDGSRLDNVAGRDAELFEARTGRLVYRFHDLTVPFECPTERALTEDLTTLPGLRSVLEGYLSEGD